MVLSIKLLKIGILRTNCYIVTDLKTNDALLIDCPIDFKGSVDEILISLKGKNLRAILYTHNHLDHIGGGHLFKVNQFMNKLGIKTLHEQIEYATKYKLVNFNIPSPLPFEEMPIKILEDFKFKIIHTPGHSADSSVFYFYDENILFSGDTVFKNFQGRTDLKYSSEEDMKKSLKKIFEIIDDETIIYPGHGITSDKNNMRITFKL